MTLVCAMIGLLRPARLVPMLIVLAVFQGAAAINLLPGGYIPIAISISPYYLLALVCCMRLLPDFRVALAGLRRAGHEFVVEFRLWVAFSVWSVCTAFLLPRFFAGQPVDDPRTGMDLTYTHLTALQFSHSNIAQIAYLMLNLAVLTAAFASVGSGRMTIRLQRAFELSGVFVLGFGAYQKAASILHLPFPAAFLDSNIQNFTAGGFNTATYGLGLRISSTFSEPSYAGGFYAVFFAYAAVLALRRQRGARGYALLAAASLVMLTLTGATTGYAAALIVVPAVVLFEAVLPGLRRGIKPAYLIGAGAVVAAIAGEIMLIPSSAVMATLNGELLHKLQTGSAMHGLAADRVAWDLFLHTGGLGVGLGSERPRNFALYLLSNVGLIGTGLLTVIVVRLGRFCRRILRLVPRRDERSALLAAAVWALGVQLLTMLISIPDLSWPELWVLLALVGITAAEIATQRPSPPGWEPASAFAREETIAG